MDKRVDVRAACCASAVLSTTIPFVTGNALGIVKGENFKCPGYSASFFAIFICLFTVAYAVGRGAGLELGDPVPRAWPCWLCSTLGARVPRWPPQSCCGSPCASRMLSLLYRFHSPNILCTFEYWWSCCLTACRHFSQEVC